MTDDSTSVEEASDPRHSGLPSRPGKIVAIHLSYASRADQRGRRPTHPSYFFKPSSSVAPSGGTVERPRGTELLAFEGEIALVIGTVARRVPLDRAWDHVAWVTAANDLGLYDLRANDKGSNVRSKGGDGFTPVGPGLLDARTVEPGALRLRAWVNGELRQEDTTAGLLFPLPQLVADLSQHLTLEPGDVILTGTPAGSSVVVPGDVVEVEVDAPDTPGSPTSGRLRTTVVQGEHGFDGALGSLPAVDDVRQARELNRRLIASLEHFDPRLFTSLNHRFHSVLFAACPNPRMLALVESEWVRLGHLRDSTFSFVPGRAQESVREHETLLGLIEAGAPLADIERAARSHRSATLAAYLSHEHPDEAPGEPGVPTAP